MQFNNKNIITFVVLAGYCGGSCAVYSSAINRKANQIGYNFIYQSSAVVAAKEKPSLSDAFKAFLNNDKSMQKIKKINKEGTSETTLEVTALEEDIAAKLDQKKYELEGAYNSCLPKQIGLGVAVGGGLAAVVLAVKRKRHSRANIVIAGGGALAGLVGGVGLFMMAGEKGRLEKHIKQVQVMKKDWDAFFVVSEQK